MIYSFQFEHKEFQRPLEMFIFKTIQRIILNFHREMFCSIDEWIDFEEEELAEFETKCKSLTKAGG